MKKKSRPESKSKTAAEKSSGRHDFLVVGIGASAGGVKALQEFFSTMPPNSGMAFVVILHLSPEHESSLAEIIQAQTAMTVTQVNKSHKVEPNNVYVIPPNRQLEMMDGVVRGTKPADGHGRRVAIDTFFRTLADAYGRNAVCIVMSGTGSDGTLGLKRIKESNGFAIVQDPQDAEYDPMPRSAINTHLADWILPIKQMPEKLIDFRESSERLHLTTDDDAKVARETNADESLREILTLLRVRTGHDFSNYKTPTLIRRIARHLQIHNLEDIPAYLTFLRDKPEEINSLLKNLLINVTNFFRDKEAWDALENDVIPNLFAGKKANDMVRVWSAGCASGEEAYSLAMLLNEYAYSLSDPPQIQVFATDVDEQAIAEAREHRYPPSIAADVEPEGLKRFFVKEGEHYRVKKEIRETVLFAPHNVLRDPPFSKLDLVVCRNLLIYLNRETQDRLMEIFHFALAGNGFLFLGSSEIAEGSPKLFQIVDKKQRIYSRRPAPDLQFKPPLMPVFGRWRVNIPEAKIKNDRAFSLGEVHYKLLEKFAPPSILVNHDFEVQYMSDTAGRFLKFKGGELHNNLLKLVNPDLLPDLRAALFSAQRDRTIAEFKDVHCVIDERDTTVNIVVRAVDVDNASGDFLLVIFDETSDYVIPQEKEKKTPPKSIGKEAAAETFVRRLEEELVRTKENLRSTIEQHEISIEELKASNEELQAINEELRSATEELETSKEELQSVNEELTTVNHELKDKMDETSRANSDLQNLMSSTDIATIFLDRTLRIKRFTPPIEKLFNITLADVGRPLAHFTNKLNYENLAEDAALVLRSLLPLEREISDKNKHFFIARFAPYRTIDDKIDGIVLNFLDITDRRRMEEALSESEDHFRAFVTASSEVVYRMNADWSEMYFLDGKNFIADTGDPRTTWIEKYIPEEDKPLVLKVIQKAIRTKSIFELEHSVIRADGTIGWAFSRAIPLLNEKGKITEWFGSASNITERKRAEEILQFRGLLLNTVEQSVIATDLDGKITYWNRFAENLFGWKAEEVIGHSVVELIAPEVLNERSEEIMSTLREGQNWSGEFRLKKRDGTEFPGYVSDAPISDDKGNLLGIVGVAVDLSERKRAEIALRKSEDQLHLIMESISDYAIITFDLEGRITRWNTGAEKIFGYPAEQAIGQMTHLIFTPEDRTARVPEKEMAKALKTGRAEDERWHQRKDGSRFFATGVMQTLRDGETQGFVKIARDETDKIKAETAVLEKQLLHQFVRTQEDERRRIARDIHDQFGQQLTALRLKLDSLKKMCEQSDFPGKEKITAQVDEVQKTGEQLDRDVDFLAWELRPASLDDLGLRLTLTNFVKEWSNYTGIKTDFHTSGLGKVQLSGETETNLYRVAQEALNNILKHAKAKTVSVLLEKRKDSVVLIIEDDGIGFDAKKNLNRPKGLGIVGMKERAELIGGTFEIESAPKKGTTIFVRAPVKPNEN